MKISIQQQQQQKKQCPPQEEKQQTSKQRQVTKFRNRISERKKLVAIGAILFLMIILL